MYKSDCMKGSTRQTIIDSGYFRRDTIHFQEAKVNSREGRLMPTGNYRCYNKTKKQSSRCKHLHDCFLFYLFLALYIQHNPLILRVKKAPKT
jgi:hypothetical protein